MVNQSGGVVSHSDRTIHWSHILSKSLCISLFLATNLCYFFWFHLAYRERICIERVNLYYNLQERKFCFKVECLKLWNHSKNWVWLRGLFIIPTDIGFVFGNKGSMKMFSILLDIKGFLLKQNVISNITKYSSTVSVPIISKYVETVYWDFRIINCII